MPGAPDRAGEWNVSGKEYVMLILVLKYIAAIVIPYLIGSINVAVLMSTGLFRKDVRETGSGNAGATNVARTFGLGAGIATLLCDFAKAGISLLIGRALLGDIGAALAGAACALGHCWPVFFGFRGGKGVAVGGGIALFYDWRIFLVLLVGFAITFILSRKVSLSSMVGAALFPISTIFLHLGWLAFGLGLFAAACVFIRHRENIIRLINGTEKDFTFPKRNKK